MHEPEIALQLAHDLPASGAPYDAAAIRAATALMLPAFELIGTCFTPWTESGATNLITDNAAHGHWIIGAPCQAFHELDLLDAPITLSIDGAVVATGCGRNVDGGAFGATAWLANALAAQGQALRAGEYVTTGSVTPPRPIVPGQRVEADLGPLGRIALESGR